MSIDYVEEKLSVGVYTLATSPQSIQERLADAFMSSVMRLNVDDFPEEEMRRQFAALSEALTSETPVANEGSINASVKIMTDDQASEHARTIFGLYQAILFYQRDQ